MIITDPADAKTSKMLVMQQVTRQDRIKYAKMRTTIAFVAQFYSS